MSGLSSSQLSFNILYSPESLKYYNVLIKSSEGRAVTNVNIMAS